MYNVSCTVKLINNESVSDHVLLTFTVKLEYCLECKTESVGAYSFCVKIVPDYN